MANQILMKSGAMIELTDIDPRAVCIEDIAHNLSNLCRFTGAVSRFYSVAEHSNLVALILQTNKFDDAVVLHGLLHDATEAYLGDVSSPLKALLPAYQAIEKNAERAIFEGLGVEPVARGIVHEADKMAFHIEANALQDRKLPLDQNQWVLQVPRNECYVHLGMRPPKLWASEMIRNYYRLKEIVK